MARKRWTTAGWLAFATLASCTPQVSTTGAVQCGEGRVCPPDFTCRFNRCCPIGDDAGLCPTEANIARIDDGTLECDSQGQCPNAHGYECRMGRYCCPRDANPATGPCARGALGNPCVPGMTTCQSPTATGGDASGVGMCRDRVFLGLYPLPNGYCSAACDTVNLASCGSSGLCIDLGFNEKLCVARCRLPEGADFGPCRVEPNGQRPAPYVCLPVAPGDPSNREGYCFPDCTASPALCGTNICNPSTRRCESACTAATNCGVGRMCNLTTRACEPSDCRAGASCASGQVCDTSNGRCVRDCRVVASQCLVLQRCDATSGLCVRR